LVGVIAWRFAQSAKNAPIGQKSGGIGDASEDASQQRHDAPGGQSIRLARFEIGHIVIGSDRGGDSQPS
jgi:hypothetical protein